MVIFSKALLRKLLYHSYVKVSSQQLRDTFNSSVLKDTLWLKISWAWIKIGANSLIKTLVNSKKRKSAKVPWTLSLAKKNANPHFKEHCLKIHISLVVILFFFSQTNLAFKYNPLFIDILIFTFILRIFKFIQCLYVFFIKTSKVLIRFNVLFVRFSSSKCFVMSCFPWKTLTC